jgi:hypothetical protein
MILSSQRFFPQIPQNSDASAPTPASHAIPSPRHISFRQVKFSLSTGGPRSRETPLFSPPVSLDLGGARPSDQVVWRHTRQPCPDTIISRRSPARCIRFLRPGFTSPKEVGDVLVRRWSHLTRSRDSCSGTSASRRDGKQPSFAACVSHAAHELLMRHRFHLASLQLRIASKHFLVGNIRRRPRQRPHERQNQLRPFARA